jgi:hypothetical protein
MQQSQAHLGGGSHKALIFATRSIARRQSHMTSEHEGELTDQALDEVAGGIIPTIVEVPTLKVSGGSEPKPGFMDYTDDDCSG